MGRGEVWLAQVGRKLCPVVVVTRDEVLDVRSNVTVAEISTTARGFVVEVPVDPDCGIEQASVVNRDGLRTVSQRRLTGRLGSVDDDVDDHLAEPGGGVAWVGADVHLGGVVRRRGPAA